MPHRLLPRTPALYHGTQKSRPYFEGWYFRFVSKSRCPVAVIPGVFRGMQSNRDISFIQVLYGMNGESVFLQYPFDAFHYRKDTFLIRIGENRFSLDGVHLDVHTKGFHFKADLLCSNHTFLKSSLFSPSIMGPFSYLPGMQCNHGVLSLAGDVTGNVLVNGTGIDMDGATGYIEKDWGESFPESWVWLQGNGCDDQGDTVSCMCSIAKIPYGPLHFTGLIAVFHAGGVEHRFATYNGSRIVHLKKTGDGVDIELQHLRHTLAVSARAQSYGQILAPTATGMDRTVHESLGASICVTMLKNGNPLFSCKMENGGLEISNVEGLLKPHS